MSGAVSVLGSRHYRWIHSLCYLEYIVFVEGLLLAAFVCLAAVESPVVGGACEIILFRRKTAGVSSRSTHAMNRRQTEQLPQHLHVWLPTTTKNWLLANHRKQVFASGNRSYWHALADCKSCNEAFYSLDLCMRNITQKSQQLFVLLHSEQIAA